MKILEGEIDLRNETRVAEQNRSGLEELAYRDAGEKLSAVQTELRDRTEDVTQAIRELPKSDEYFANEVQLLSTASRLMTDAEDMLNDPETGPDVIAIETEIIELLLQAKRSNSKGGGGGGSNPGGGGKGDTEVAALSLIGAGVDVEGEPDESDVNQATGANTNPYPEEFKSGLDAYFQKFEQNLKK